MAATLDTIQKELEGQRVLLDEFKKTNEEKLQAKADGKTIVDLQAKLDKLNDAMAENAAKIDTLQQTLAEKNTATAIHSVSQEMKDFSNFIKKGIVNAVSVGTNGNGGYAVPEEIDREIERLAVGNSALAELVTIKSNVPAGYHKLVDLKGTAVTHSTEFQIINQTDTSTLVKVSPIWGKIEAKPYISQEALDDIFFNVEEWVNESVEEAIQDQLEVDLMSGAGSSGVTKGLLQYTMSTDVDGTREFGQFQYIASGASGAFPSTNPGDGIDKLIDLQTQLKAAYGKKACWLVSAATKGAVRKMKDSQGNYYWEPSIVLGAPEVLLGKALYVSDAMPSVGTANAYAVAYGDFKRALRLCFTGKVVVLRDPYTHAPNLQFVFSKRYGLMVNNSEAIKFLKLSA
jgi:HK97 family phage major capsid protein